MQRSSTRSATSLPVEPRCFTREQAAAYCGLTPEGFTAWQRQGIVPPPIPRTKRWDRKALDAALDRHSGLATSEAEIEDPFDKWKRDNGYAD